MAISMTGHDEGYILYDLRMWQERYNELHDKQCQADAERRKVVANGKK